MDVSDRDEKLRLARKKLGKFQKNKTKLAAVGAEPASSIDAGKTGSNAEGSVAETAQSPRVNLRPVSPSVYAVHHPLNSHSSVHPGHSPSAQSPTKSISHSSQDMSSGGIQNHQNDIKKRSMFTSFVSAVTNTAASIMNTDDQQGIHNQHNQQELDNARNALAAAKEERRSRSSSPMRFRSPSPARNAVTNTTGGVFGMASRLFTTAASSSQSQSTPNAHLYSDQYSNQNHQDHNTQQLHVHDDYQYGQQEGRDFGIGLEGSGYGVGTYSDPTSYQYKSNQSQLVDPSAYYQQDHMQQGQEHTQPVQQQQSFEHLSHHSFETAQYQHDQQPQPQQISSNGYQNNEMYAQYPDQYQMQQQLQQPYIDEQQDYYASDNTATSIGYYNDALVQDHAHNQNYYDVGYTQQAAYYEHQQYRSHEVPQFSDVNDGFQQQELYARQQIRRPKVHVTPKCHGILICPVQVLPTIQFPSWGLCTKMRFPGLICQTVWLVALFLTRLQHILQGICPIRPLKATRFCHLMNLFLWGRTDQMLSPTTMS
ncbi:hypothetical protein BC830DRAFT_473623 [Chytriomyces sp. MP71]|nr:hypothetical protein BC830DRAFT_473623 [Chytriomyces sp. MP71]